MVVITKMLRKEKIKKIYNSMVNSMKLIKLYVIFYLSFIIIPWSVIWLNNE